MFLGNESPYELLIGQKPNQGLLTLSRHPDLLPNLQREAHLQSALDLPATFSIGDARVNEDSLILVADKDVIVDDNNKAIVLNNEINIFINLKEEGTDASFAPCSMQSENQLSVNAELITKHDALSNAEIRHARLWYYTSATTPITLSLP